MTTSQFQWVAKRSQLSDSIYTVRIQSGNRDLNIGDVLSLLFENVDFRAWFSKTIASSSYEAFYWEVVPINKSLMEKPFEFAQTKASALVGVQGDPKPFSNQFAADKKSEVIAFPNLGGDATLIVPRQLADTASYGHLAAFLRTAPENQVDSFWKLVAGTIRTAISDRVIWLGTAGLGVSWLHLRLDSHPKYYRHVAYKNMVTNSR